MTEKRFDVVYEEDDEYKNIKYWEIIDTKSQNSTSNELEIVKLLNELDEKWIGELNLRETLQLDLKRVEEENKELKAQLNEIGYYFRDGVTLRDLDNNDFEELRRLSSNETE